MSIPRRSRPLAAAVALSMAALARPAETQAPPAPPSASADPRVDPAPIESAIRKLAAEVQRWGGTLGVQAIDVVTGLPIAALDEHRAENPASNAKLVTAAVALRVLGGQHRFLTGLYGRVDDGGVGELVLRGDGDPSLRTQDLWAMASELRASGVRRVRAILVDQGFFDERWVPPAFEQQPGEWAAFRAPVAAVSLNENTVLFTVRAAKEGAEALVEVDPPGFVDLTGSVATTRSTDPEKVTVGVEARGARLTAQLGGSIPEGDDRLMRVARRVDDPRLLAGYALRAVLRQVGIDARAASIKLGGTSSKALLVAHRSVSLGELLWALGKDSDNFYAEMVFKAIGAQAKGRPASADAATEAVGHALDEIGAAEAGVVIKNGSGLFDANRTTAAATTTLLRAMYRDPGAAPEYVAQLSIGGVDGTLRHRFADWAKARAVRAKTGYAGRGRGPLGLRAPAARAAAGRVQRAGERHPGEGERRPAPDGPGGRRPRPGGMEGSAGQPPLITKSGGDTARTPPHRQ